MEEIEIKHEFNEDEKAQCSTCLSVGRNLVPLGEFTQIYQKLIPDHDEYRPVCTEQLLVCWECHTLLHRVVKFQYRVRKANNLMKLGQGFLYGTLSTLTTVILSDTHPHTIYVDSETHEQTDGNVNENQEAKNITGFEDDIEEFDDTKTDFNNDSPDVIGLNQDDTEEKSNRTVKLGTSIKLENIKLEKSKTKNENSKRWARKRAELNRKPKFKIVRVDTNFSYKRYVTKTSINLTELSEYLKRERDNESYKLQKYKCERCILVFQSTDNLENHNRMKHNQIIGSYVCDICETRFWNKRHLSTHVGKHYYSRKCDLCAFVCHSTMRMRMHLREEHRSLFECLKCQLRFGSRKDFFIHYKEWHEKFTCDYCGKTFKMRYCIKEHIRKQHSPFECKQCEKRFARYNGLWLHNKVCHGPPTTPAYCVECDKRYPDIYRYRWHLASSVKHRPRPPDKTRIPCPGCDKVFTKNIYMKDHYNLVHLKNYKYRCEECDKNFLRNADLVQHKRRVHEGILPPKNKICYMCGRGFTTNKILTNHLRTHTGERPFACARCPARFAQRAALAGHCRALHQDKTHN